MPKSSKLNYGKSSSYPFVYSDNDSEASYSSCGYNIASESPVSKILLIGFVLRDPFTIGS